MPPLPVPLPSGFTPGCVELAAFVSLMLVGLALEPAVVLAAKTGAVRPIAASKITHFPSFRSYSSLSCQLGRCKGAGAKPVPPCGTLSPA